MPEIIKIKINCLYITLVIYIFTTLNKLIICDDISNDSDEPSFRRICYYANWATYRNISPILYPDNIDPSLCTHIQ